ncbi:MAG: hypothetical protein IKI37_06240, partial [Oscillospiraceae bacterium]|nr:hypothetical protein [Oscillospiraceae bacterium]
MKFNNNIKGSTKKRSIMKRLCGIDVASAIFITSMPAVIFETIPSAFLSVHAANKDDFTKYTDESKDITAASD